MFTLIAELRTEHDLIEKAVGALVGWAQARALGQAEASDGRALLHFFQAFAGRFHHGREEQVLFPALVAQAGLPLERGPLHALLADHRELEALLAELAGLIDAPSPRLPELALRYGEQLLHHIDAENHVVLPECEARLRRAGLVDLAGPPASAEALAARAEGERLVSALPAADLGAVWRGEGCVNCPSYGVRCDGIEREWWSELEWEDAFARMGSG